MGIIIVTVMFYLLLAFWIAGMYKARFIHKQPWGACLIIALESPLCFLSAIYWKKEFIMEIFSIQKKNIEKEEGRELDTYEYGLLIECVLDTVPHSLPYIHSETIAFMVVIRQDSRYNSIRDFYLKSDGSFR